MQPDRNPPSTTGGGTRIAISVPIREARLFRYGATADILGVVSDNPDVDFSVRQLSRLIDFSEKATREAIDVLEANDIVVVDHRENARRVHINRSRLTKPDDPIRSIPQAEFHAPVNLAHQYILHELEDVQGVVLFGSVATGAADRQSDIDLWVLVGDDLLENRHTANKLITELESRQIPPTIAYADEIDLPFDQHWEEVKKMFSADHQHYVSAQRYSFEIVVETPASIIAQQSRIEPVELFGRGITLTTSEEFEAVKRAVMADE